MNIIDALIGLSSTKSGRLNLCFIITMSITLLVSVIVMCFFAAFRVPTQATAQLVTTSFAVGLLFVALYSIYLTSRRN